MAAQQKEERAKKMRYENRKNSVLRKGQELSTLCDVKLCVILVSPDGKLETWPKDLNNVKAILNALKQSVKPVYSEHHQNNRGRKRKLCSRVELLSKKTTEIIAASNGGVADVKGKQIVVDHPVIDQQIGNGNIAYVEEKRAETMAKVAVFYDGSGSNQWNGIYSTSAINSGMCIPNVVVSEYIAPPAIGFSDMVLNQDHGSCYGNQDANTHSTCVPYQWNGNENTSENFGKSILDMVANQEPSFYACGRYQQYESGSTSATNSVLDMVESHTCGRYQQYESGSTSAMNSVLDMVENQELSPYACGRYQQYESGSTSAMNSDINFSNMVVNQHPDPCYAYGQYQWSGNSIAMNSGMQYPSTGLNSIMQGSTRFDECNLPEPLLALSLKSVDNLKFANFQFGYYC